MIKTVVVPQNNNFNIVIPNQYVGKKIEILVYALDEVAEEESIPIKKTMADFLGTLSDATANDLHQHLTESRNSWEERINKQL